MAIAYEDAPGIKTLSQIGILLWHMVYYLWDLYSEFSSQSKCLRRITKLLWLSDWPKITKEASWPRGDLNLECGNLCSSKQYWQPLTAFGSTLFCHHGCQQGNLACQPQGGTVTTKNNLIFIQLDKMGFDWRKVVFTATTQYQRSPTRDQLGRNYLPG